MAVRLFLLRHHRHMRNAQLFQQLFHTFQAGTVQRGVDQFQVSNACTVTYTLGIDGIHKVVQTLFRAVLDLSLRKSCVKIGRLHRKAVHGFDGGEDFCSHLQRDLAAVRTIDLVAVVLGGVVAGGDADARAAAVVPHRPAQCRGGLQAGVDVSLDAVGGKDSRRFLGEHIALDAAVVPMATFFGKSEAFR